jgi:dipeptidyl aminopeptidase/acylaminoacyl peptidase
MPLPPLYSIEDLFADPVYTGGSLSSDGTRIAYIAPKYGRTQVWVRGVDQEHDDAICVTHDERRGIKRFGWTDNPRYLIYEQDTDGNEQWHLWRVDLDNPEAPAVDLTPNPEGVRAMGWGPAEWAPGHIVVSMNKRLMYFDQFLVNVETGETTLHVEQPGLRQNWLIDNTGALRFYMDIADDAAYEFGAVDPETLEKRELVRLTGPAYPLGVSVLHITHDGSAIVLGMYPEGSDDLSLVRIDRATGEQTVIAALEGHNVCNMGMVSPLLPAPFILSKKTKEPIAVRFVGDRPIYKVIDPDYEGLWAALAAIEPDKVISGAHSDKEEKRWIVSFTDDREPGLSYLYDRETGEHRLLFRPFPQLNPEHMAPMTAVHIDARDGLPLTAFLTLPVGVEATNLPLVLKVHGGPWCHDSWTFDREVQFFANRGYAVLQINFRGSSGYGAKHISAGVKELGGKMHDDLIDFADWAVAEGIADPSKIAIYGGSYGGYATLMAVTMTPDYFACACDYVGISNLANFMATLPEFTKPLLGNSWFRYVGDPDNPKDLEFMLSRSAITMVDKIKTPLLITQGANDARVVQAEADNIVAALTDNGIDVEYMLCEDEGHGFQNPENIMEMFRRIESHFGKYLGARS